MICTHTKIASVCLTAEHLDKQQQWQTLDDINIISAKREKCIAEAEAFVHLSHK
jgi:hypothetical protein